MMLGQSALDQRVFEAIAWFGGMLLAMLAMGVVLAYLRKRLKPVARTDDTGLDLEQLTALAGQGRTLDGGVRGPARQDHLIVITRSQSRGPMKRSRPGDPRHVARTGFQSRQG